VSTPATPAFRSAKKNSYGLPVSGKLGRFVIVWPAVIGVPVPTVPIRTAEPELVETYSCPSNIYAARRFTTVVLICVDVVAPSIAYLIPPVLPVIHRSSPSVLTAPRGLPPLAASVRAVVVSMVPVGSARPMTRLMAVDVEPVILAVPISVS
jgi:hypothetical protein